MVDIDNPEVTTQLLQGKEMTRKLFNLFTELLKNPSKVEQYQTNRILDETFENIVDSLNSIKESQPLEQNPNRSRVN